MSSVESCVWFGGGEFDRCATELAWNFSSFYLIPPVYDTSTYFISSIYLSLSYFYISFYSIFKILLVLLSIFYTLVVI